MDPDKALEDIRKSAAEVLGYSEPGPLPAWELEAAARELAHTVRALDEWLSRGGFLPAPWGGRR